MLTRGLNRYGWDWDPWTEMRRLSNEMGRLLDGRGSGIGREYPLVNAWTNEDEAIITAELPGVDTKDLDISVQGNTLTLKGSRTLEELKEKQSYHRHERGSGSFVRTMELPFEVDQSKVEANLNKGVLKIKLPKAEDAKPRKVTIKAT